MIEFQTRVSSTYLKTFFPNWEEVFGKHPSIKMTLQSKSAPKLNLKQSASKIYADTFIRIHNPYTDEYDAVTITCAIVFSLEFDLLNDATIAGKITEMEPSVSDLKVYFISDMTKESMNLQVQAIASPFTTLINSQLVQGYQLPLPRTLQQDLSQTRMYTYDSFIMIESNPQVQQKLEEKVNDVAENMQRLLEKKFSPEE